MKNKSKYRFLKAGEVIKEDDEVRYLANSPEWFKVDRSIGCWVDKDDYLDFRRRLHVRIQPLSLTRYLIKNCMGDTLERLYSLKAAKHARTLYDNPNCYYIVKVVETSVK